MAKPVNFYSNTRYSNVSIFLHWTIAALIVLNIVLGWIMHTPEGMAETPFALHQSVGVTILALSLVRLGWRLSHPWLGLPTVMLGWEKALARFTHVAFYVAMIGIPLLGYLALSSRGNGPTFFGLFTLPPLPIGESRDQAELFGFWHVTAVYTTVALLVLHIAGALKHTYVQHNHILSRMIPALKTPGPGASAPADRLRTDAPRRERIDH